MQECEGAGKVWVSCSSRLNVAGPHHCCFAGAFGVYPQLLMHSPYIWFCRLDARNMDGRRGDCLTCRRQHYQEKYGTQANLCLARFLTSMSVPFTTQLLLQAKMIPGPMLMRLKR